MKLSPLTWLILSLIGINYSCAVYYFMDGKTFFMYFNLGLVLFNLGHLEFRIRHGMR